MGFTLIRSRSRFRYSTGAKIDKRQIGRDRVVAFFPPPRIAFPAFVNRSAKFDRETDKILLFPDQLLLLFPYFFRNLIEKELEIIAIYSLSRDREDIRGARSRCIRDNERNEE